MRTKCSNGVKGVFLDKAYPSDRPVLTKRRRKKGGKNRILGKGREILARLASSARLQRSYPGKGRERKGSSSSKQLACEATQEEQRTGLTQL